MNCPCEKNQRDIKSIKANVLKTYEYKANEIFRGYTNKTLHIDVTNYEIKIKDVTEDMKDKFIGGKGFDLWYLWHAVTGDTKWNNPENEIVISPGPVAGITQYPGAGKSLVCSISPLTGTVVDSNVGGHFGPYLKFSGFDALELQGKSDKDVIIYIDGNKNIITIEEDWLESRDSHLIAEDLTERFADNEEDKRNISVISAGQAAENTLLGVLNFSFYDKARKCTRLKQAGRGGIGTVLRDKKIKALVIKFSGTKGDLNHPADFKKLQEVGFKLHKEVHDYDNIQTRKRQVGTANIVEVMNDYDLLPVHNFKYGSHPEAWKISSPELKKRVTQGLADGCWYGCSLACAKAADNFELKTGPYKGTKVCVDGCEYETVAGDGSNCGIFDMDYVFECNFYCDTYGIDTISFGTICAFVMECYEAGVLNKERTGGLELTFGNADASMEMLHQMARGEGFGVTAGLGVRRMKHLFAEKYGVDFNFLNDIGMENKGLEYSQYMSKESLAQQGGYALANKGPQHDEAWVIFMDMVNNALPTFEAKAEALFYFPMFRTWFGLQGLCKLPWNDIEPGDNKMTDEPAKVPEHVQNYVDIYNAVTGKIIDKNELIRQSERVYNFQKVFNLKMGMGTRKDDVPPYRSVGPVTKEEYISRHERYDKQLKEIVGVDLQGKSVEEKIAILRKYREEQYDKLCTVVYRRKGWTDNAVPTLEHLHELGIDYPEVVEVVKQYL